MKKKGMRLAALMLALIMLTGCTLLSDVGDILSNASGVNLNNLTQPNGALSDDKLELPGASGEGFSIFFIDVGQADSAVVMCDGKSMLIDGGNSADSSRVVSILSKLGISHIDAVVCTHAHEDHVGGLSGPLSVVKTDSVFAPDIGADTKAYQNFLKSVGKLGIKITHPEYNQKINIGSALVTFLSPTKAIAGEEDLNNTSIVLKIEYGGTSFLFMGDAEYELENVILDSGADVTATLMKVGHHGSENATSYRFLREVMPKYAIISVGKDNSYGHPSEAALSRLSDAGVNVLRTDTSGDIIVTSDGKELSFFYR